MSPRFEFLAIAALGVFLAACTNGSAKIGDIKSVDYVEEDLTRWMHLPYASLPPPRFIRVREDGHYNSGGGTPNLKISTKREMVAVNGAFSNMRVQTTGQSIRTTNYFRSFMGIHNMSSLSRGGWGQGSRRILEVVPGRVIPLNPVVKSRYPELQGVSASDLSHDFTWKIRIGQGGASERWFKVSSQIIDMAPTAVTVNGKEYVIDAYVIDYSITNVQRIFKRELKFWYLPVFGWYAKYEMRSESQRGASRAVYDNVSFEVTEEVLAEFMKYAKPAGS